MQNAASPHKTYDPNNLSAMIYANGFTVWHYKAIGNTPEDVIRAGFFNDADHSLRVGDSILINIFDNNGDHIASAQFFCVGNHDGTVTIARSGEWAYSLAREAVAA